MREPRCCVAHTLTGRYATGSKRALLMPEVLVQGIKSEYRLVFTTIFITRNTFM